MPNKPHADAEIKQEAEKDLLFSNLLNDDYFKLKLNDEVRKRTEVELNTWWKRVVGIVAIILSIIAAFGIKEYFSFKSAIDEAKQGIKADRDEANAAIKEQRTQFNQSNKEVAALISDAGSELSKMQAIASSVQAGQLVNDARLNQQLNGVIKASNEFERTFGGFKVDFDRTQNDLKENSKNVAARLKNTEELLSQSEDMLSTVSRDQERGQSRFDKELKGPFLDLKQEVSSVKDKVFGSGSYIIKERMPDQVIKTVERDANQDLLIDVGRLHIDDLLHFRVRDRRGNVLYDDNLKIGKLIEFRTGGYEYKLIARYILRITFGSDAAGIDISWAKEKEKENEKTDAAS